jgi:succinate-semialdehyde dehydrogenase / glutarate-semialdehyde dehydrogenase
MTTTTAYPHVQLMINNEWRAARGSAVIPVHNPATGEVIGSVAHATIADLDDALAATAKGFEVWKNTPAVKRSEIMRRIDDFGARQTAD